VIRFAGLIGPKRHPGRFFTMGKSVKDSDARINLIHLDDCIKLIQTIIEQQAWGEIFNGCADSHPTKKEYYINMATKLGYSAPECLTVEASATKIVCNEKIKNQLGYEFIHPDLYKIAW
jgi:nucleoside-diphosphate-sugar epimerase